MDTNRNGGGIITIDVMMIVIIREGALERVVSSSS